MKKIIFIFTISISTSIWSQVIVDVYGVDKNTGKKILQKYSRIAENIESQKMQFFLKKETIDNNSKKLNAILKRKENLLKQIQKHEGFLFVDFQTVQYPNTKDLYTTIEIITKNEPWRFKFIPRNFINHNSRLLSKLAAESEVQGDEARGTAVYTSVHEDSSTESTKQFTSAVEFRKKSSQKQDLKTTEFQNKSIIQDMLDYEELAMQLVMSNRISNKQGKCPVYHCIAPFSHPTLKPYLAKFNLAAINQQDFIIDTLERDPVPERRAAAAFLIGHFKNPKKIINVLMPHIQDDSDIVRNNVMRVLGMTIATANIQNIDPVPFLKQLDSPFVTDRNKALFVLLAIANSENGKQLILKHGSTKLLKVLHLKQPNNHDIAYLILKTISNQTYSGDDLIKWENWNKKISLSNALTPTKKKI